MSRDILYDRPATIRHEELSTIRIAARNVDAAWHTVPAPAAGALHRNTQRALRRRTNDETLILDAARVS